MKLYHDSFDTQIQSEDFYTTDPAELAEIQSLMATPDEDEWQAYGDWSEEIEAKAWAGAVPVETPNGQILVKSECDRAGLHRDCSIYKCKRAVRLEGIEI
ncbi:MAG: hypothetical protein L0229_00215 [Blastocatellia bacterium]|nr:hypothetical protein [Blastocatellia bacterium]